MKSFAIKLILLLSFAWPAAAQEGPIRIQILENQTPVFATTEDGAPVRMKLKKGKKLVVNESDREGYFQVVTKSGQSLFVRAADVRVLSRPSVEDDLVSPEDVGRAPAASEEADVPDKWRLTFDLGLSTGSVNNVDYTEAGLGINLYFKRWLAWRNALFGRFGTDFETLYGVDTSLRGIYDADLGPVGGITVFAGPGYRFVNQGRDAPFVEGGIVFKLLGIALGGGVKTVMNKTINKDTPNDTQYFIILSGGGSL